MNAATHIIDPWPRYVGNRRIPANGERMAGAVERYRTNTPWATPCPITPTFDIQTGGIVAQTTRGCAQSGGAARRCAGAVSRARDRASAKRNQFLAGAGRSLSLFNFFGGSWHCNCRRTPCDRRCEGRESHQ